MIVLDINVISELWKIEPDSNVLAWLDAQMVETLYLSTITIAELRFGLASMPDGKRRMIYQDRLEREVLPAFTGRILSFDLDASKAYAQLMARAKQAGKAIGLPPTDEAVAVGGRAAGSAPGFRFRVCPSGSAKGFHSAPARQMLPRDLWSRTHVCS